MNVQFWVVFTMKVSFRGPPDQGDRRNEDVIKKGIEIKS